VDAKTVFIIVWVAGAAISAVAFRATRNLPPLRRIALCSLALAATVTPTIVAAHIPVIWPAIGVLLLAPFDRPYGVPFALLFGLLPIAVIWALIAAVWLAIRKIRSAYFTRL
jgi:hypothetical protein